MKIIKGYAWHEIITGVFLIFCGIYLAVNPLNAFSLLSILLALYFIISGIIDFIFVLAIHRKNGHLNTVMMIASGLSIILGAVMLGQTGSSRLLLASIIPLWYIIHSITRLALLDYTSIIFRGSACFLDIIIAVIGLLLGINLLLSPLLSILTLIGFLCFYLILAGLNAILNGIQILKHSK